MNKLKTAVGIPRTMNLNPNIEQVAKSEEGYPIEKQLQNLEKAGELASDTMPTVERSADETASGLNGHSQ
eukprot:CAMPEP_0170502914 /NCGR_PEP_ID=MMETSP0208-20121228/42974_1 /TAXON_ID=197538 /ORGANISM="Strombidium inclinatum, Strain S3" /LENGTH=69 /DNA_ID=CAMNT_0010782265 /DNA_START=159 /DNA_END=368 /DNA_ORIENTATION=+